MSALLFDEISQAGRRSINGVKLKKMSWRFPEHKMHSNSINSSFLFCRVIAVEHDTSANANYNQSNDIQKYQV